MPTPLLMVGVPTVLTTNTTTALPASSTLISFQSAAGSTIEASNDGVTWGTLATSAANVVVSVFTAAVFIRTATANTTVTAKATTTRSQAQFLAGNGSAVAPSYSFVNEPTTGFRLAGANNLAVSMGASTPVSFIPAGIFFNNTSGMINFTADSGLSRIGVASLALGNGTAGDFTGTLKLTNEVLVGKLTTYNNVVTAGLGVPAIYASARVLAQTAAVASVVAYTVGAADGTFEVAANILATVSTSYSFDVTVAWTDESNTARTLKLQLITQGGNVISNGAALTNATGPAFYGLPMVIRAKAATTITIATSGTFTTITYNAEGTIKQVA